MSTTEEADQAVNELMNMIEEWHPFNIFNPPERAALREHIIRVMTKVLLWERTEQEELVLGTLKEYTGGGLLNDYGATALRQVAQRQRLRREGKPYMRSTQ